MTSSISQHIFPSPKDFLDKAETSWVSFAKNWMRIKMIYLEPRAWMNFSHSCKHRQNRPFGWNWVTSAPISCHLAGEWVIKIRNSTLYQRKKNFWFARLLPPLPFFLPKFILGSLYFRRRMYVLLRLTEDWFSLWNMSSSGWLWLFEYVAAFGWNKRPHSIFFIKQQLALSTSWESRFPGSTWLPACQVSFFRSLSPPCHL